MFDYKVFPINSVNTYNNRQKQESQNTGQKSFERQNEFKRVLKDIVSIEVDRELISIETDKGTTFKEVARKEVEHMACNHNPNDKNTTLEKLHKRIMVTPTTFWFRCNKCFKGFKFIKNVEGKLEEVSEYYDS